MNVLKKRLPLLLFVLAGCGSLPVNEGLDRVKTGMEKGEVLHLAGNPKHTHFQDGKDHWLFEYYASDADMVREVTFADGRVIEVAPAHPRSQVESGAPSGDDEDMEKFENKVRETQKQHQGAFEDVPEQ